MHRSPLASLVVLLVLAGCEPPLAPCLPECGLPDAVVVRDGGTDDANEPFDAGMDAGSDAGPPQIREALDETTLPDAVCTLGRWCWVSPAVPEDVAWDDVTTIAGSMPQLWMVSDAPFDGTTPGGVIARLEGTRWRGIVGRGARRVSGSRADDVWMISGAADVIHWDGVSFESLPIPGVTSLNDIASSGPSDAWAIGDDGVLRRWVGAPVVPRDAGVSDAGSSDAGSRDAGPPVDAAMASGWTTVDIGVDFTTDLRAIQVVSPTDIWIAGSNGTVRHWDGTTWTPMDASGFDIEAIWALPMAATVWIGGPTGARYWDATSMTWRTPTGTTATNVTTIVGTRADSVYLLSSNENDYRAFGTTLTLLLDGGAECDFRSVTAYGDGYVRVGVRTAEGTLACPVDQRPIVPSDAVGVSPVARPLENAQSMVLLADDDLLVYAEEHAWRSNPAGVFMGADDLVPDDVLPGAFTLAASHGDEDIWIDAHDGAGTVQHWDGETWSPFVVAPGEVRFATDATDTWAAVRDTVFAWDDATFVAVGAPLAGDVVELAAVDGALWATYGDGTSLARFSGGAWTDLVVGTWPASCAPLSARSATTVECIGPTGRMRYVMGGALAAVPLVTGATAPMAIDGDGRALLGERGWIFGSTVSGDRVLWPAPGGDEWHVRTSGVPWTPSDVVRMRDDGTTWRLSGGELTQWRAN